MMPGIYPPPPILTVAQPVWGTTDPGGVPPVDGLGLLLEGLDPPPPPPPHPAKPTISAPKSIVLSRDRRSLKVPITFPFTMLISTTLAHTLLVGLVFK